MRSRAKNEKMSSIVFMIIIGPILILGGIYVFFSNASYYIFGKTYDLDQMIRNNESWPVDKFGTLTVNSCLGNYAETKHMINGIIPAGKDEHYILFLEDDTFVSVSVKGKKNIDALERVTDETWESEDFYAAAPVALTGIIRTGSSYEIRGYYKDALEQLGVDTEDSNVVRWVTFDATETRLGGWVLFLGISAIGIVCIWSGLDSLKKRRQRDTENVPVTTVVSTDDELDALLQADPLEQKQETTEPERKSAFDSLDEDTFGKF